MARPGLEQRLACRNAIEALHHKGRRAHGHGDFLLRHDRVAGPILRVILQAAGLYRRGVRNALNPAVITVRMPLAGLPGAFNGFRILHLSDLHIDGVDGLAEIVAETVSRLPCDLCVMTGDYRYEVEGPCDGVYPRMRTVLRGVESRHGVLAILGNHDAAEIAVELENIGVRMLVNEAVEIARGGSAIWVAGVDDPHYYGCDELPAALEQAPREALKILLAHSPEMFDEAAQAGVSLYLCGHTHGGQIRLPWIGPLLVNAACPRAYTHGCWSHSGMRGYTSAGAGCSMLPVRYNCPPELIVVELACQAES